MALFGALLLSCELVADLDRDYFQIVPDGWDGPIDLQTAEDDPAGCRHGYTQVTMLHSGLSDEIAKTACGCTPPLSACRWTMNVYELNSACTGEPHKQAPVGLGQCVAITTEVRPFSVREPVLERFSCAPTEGTLAPPQWQLNARVCRGNAGACIMRSGEWECPAGPFSDRQLLYGGALDTRGCDCGYATGSCNGRLTVFPDVSNAPGLDEQCLGEGEEIPTEVCLGPMDVGEITATSDVVELQCSRTGAAAVEGDLLPASPVTVCCQL